MTDTGSITFVPSVHFSPTHRRRVRETIRDVDPDLVAVELDERRFERLDREQRGSPFDLARELPPPTAAAYATLQALQRTVVRLYGLDPTKTDMETAIETAAELDLDVALIDDPIPDTLEALSRRVGLETLPKLLIRAQTRGPADYARQFEVMTTPFSEVTDGDDVQPVIDQLRQLLPEVAEVLIDRRDRSMAARLRRLRADGYDVVAVIGAGHHNGIRRALSDLDEGVPDRTPAVPIRTPSRAVTRIPID
ncbi:TraB domain-containing protein [Halosolutus gelatinilyticus]|uniref:TraB domain-containing protein n=1 Tax=Halosolutus gelatinilyticus TaxID=2931975 RepID=UPI001FF4AB2F|nr:TraB/GumN family protein [Halosolutus gelatinilyticus]